MIKNHFDESLSIKQKENLRVELLKGKNILIVGNVGSGKTEMMKWFLNNIEDNSRAIFIDYNYNSNLIEDSEKKYESIGSCDESIEKIKEALVKEPSYIFLDEARAIEDFKNMADYKKRNTGSIIASVISTTPEESINRLLNKTVFEEVNDEDLKVFATNDVFDLIVHVERNPVIGKRYIKNVLEYKDVFNKVIK